VENPPKFFAWLAADEELVAPDRERKKFGPHGGFVFLFHNDLDEQSEKLTSMNCYFPVICNNPNHCSEVKVSNYIAENNDPLKLEEDFRLSAKLSVDSTTDDEKKLDWVRKQSSGIKSFREIEVPQMCGVVDEETDEESEDSYRDVGVFKNAFNRQPSRFPNSISQSDVLLRANSQYKSKSLHSGGSDMLEIKEEKEDDDLSFGDGGGFLLPSTSRGTTTMMVEQTEKFAQKVKKLDGRVLGYFLASLPDNVLLKINLDECLLAASDDVDVMRVNLRNVLLKTKDHSQRIKEIRAIAKRDKEGHQEFDNCNLELLEKEFENHLSTGTDDEEGVENKLLFQELMRRFYYYVKPVKQAKAELEARIKEKHWLKLHYRDKLRLIRAKFTKIGNFTNYFSDYCYLAKTVMNFLDPPRKIPYYEDGINSDFKENEHVIIRPLGDEKPRLAEVDRKLRNGHYQLKSAVDDTFGRMVVVKPNRVQRLFKWSCFRCNNSDRGMWRDVYALKQWVCCMRCGLVTEKTLSTTRYYLRNLLRDSCYGGIYRGYDALEQRDCAIKKNEIAQVNSKMRKGTESVVAEDIFKEIKYHSMVSPKDSGISPGILRIYDEYKDETDHYIILEFADKGELFEHVVSNFAKPKALFDQQAIAEWKESMKQMFFEICLGIKKIHNEGIVHRDLSLENLLLIENQNYVKGKMPRLRPVICDFGLATKDQKMFRESVGKIGYMSPECANGRYNGKANDIWCLGIIFVMMMMGAPPYGKIDDKAFRYLIGGERRMKYLFQQYKRDHLIPQDAYEIMLGIFVRQKDRLTVEQILNTEYCRTAPYPDYLRD